MERECNGVEERSDEEVNLEYVLSGEYCELFRHRIKEDILGTIIK